jgi:hypothetical protein
VGTQNMSITPPSLGSDYIWWYTLADGGDGRIAVEAAGGKKINCGYPIGGWPDERYCNLDAAAGLYITPEQGLLLYAAEHDNDGPGGSVKFAEFRSAVARPVGEIGRAWVELYDDVDFSDRSLRIDYVDRHRKPYDDLGAVERFNDKTSAVRWAIPPGWRVRLYDDASPCGGRFVELSGTGEEADLRKEGFSDAVSCVQWVREGDGFNVFSTP